MQKVELLAPAGNYECFMAAICAGADAVYLAGNKYGARAYAGNFTQEEIIKALETAHIYNRKIYLTVNTLVKETEMSEVYDFLRPLYENGLDGVIVQDIGMIAYLRNTFPELPIHISTQMTITGQDGVAFAKELGAVRVVPARELSLNEIKMIRSKHPDMELECFIHGAMCYAYSGQCLFSSIVGGRSGNRGTCAQPCRLEYEVRFESGEKYKNKYALSLKDMMTIKLIPELIEAGISSFKIEGRMKSPEYVAGVTGIYRRVIDRYYKAFSYDSKSDGNALATSNSQNIQPTKEELRILSGLYVRSETQDGYYHRHNGKEMMTLDKPCYAGCNDEAVAYVRENFCKPLEKISVNAYCTFETGKNMELTLAMGDIYVSSSGDEVMKATNRPVSYEELCKRIKKTGDTCFEIKDINVQMSSDSFAPIGAINELRRECLEKLKEAVLCEKKRLQHNQACFSDIEEHGEVNRDRNYSYSVSCMNVSQLREIIRILGKRGFTLNLYLPGDVLDKMLGECGFQDSIPENWKIFYSLPRIVRGNNRKKICERLDKYCELNLIDGVYIHTPDALNLVNRFCIENCREGSADKQKQRVHLSPFMYTLNSMAACEYYKYSDMLSVPFELNEREIHDLFRGVKESIPFEMIVYGRIPLMVTAGCLQKHLAKSGCVKNNSNSENKKAQTNIADTITDFVKMTDRKGNVMPVLRNCENCYNEIYNSDVLSLRKYMDKLYKMKNIRSFLISFTDETIDTVDNVLDAFLADRMAEYDNNSDMNSRYTTGHFKRGVI